MFEITAECPDCGVGMQKSNDGLSRCPYCDSWAFRDAVSDGAIYAAASRTTADQRCPTCGATADQPCNRDRGGECGWPAWARRTANRDSK